MLFYQLNEIHRENRPGEEVSKEEVHAQGLIQDNV